MAAPGQRRYRKDILFENGAFDDFVPENIRLPETEGDGITERVPNHQHLDESLPPPPLLSNATETPMSIPKFEEDTQDSISSPLPVLPIRPPAAQPIPGHTNRMSRSRIQPIPATSVEDQDGNPMVLLVK